jgi:ribonuclease VapC
VIFVDASAIVSILTRETDALDLVERLEMQSERRTSAMAAYEAALAVARMFDVTPAQAYDIVARFFATYSIVQTAVGPSEGSTAISAFERYGKGRHAAKLNMGDCFAYACAKNAGAKLLFKGNDFGFTDIEAA